MIATAITLPLIVLLFLGFQSKPGAIASPLIRHPAPAFRLRTIDGGTLSLASLGGRPVVLNFWASWCTACKQEHPYLLQAWRRYSPRVTFVGVLYQDSARNARAFMRRYGGSWSSVLDPDGTTAIDYGVYGVPETFFIDRRGVVRAKSVGPVTPRLLTSQIGALLAPGR